MIIKLVILFLNIWVVSMALGRSISNRSPIAGKSLVYVISLLISACCMGMLYTVLVFLSQPFPLFLILISAVSAVLITIHRKRLNIFYQIHPDWDAKHLNLMLFLLLASSFIFIKFFYKWGGWDNIAIWSQHAKFLIADDHWRNYLTNAIAWCHPDYPLLLSSFIALVWECTGTNAITPGIISYLVLIAIVLSGYSALHTVNLYLLSLVYLLLTALDFRFVELSTWQNADSLFALFILLSFVLFRKAGETAWVAYVLGFLVFCSGWVKNEGLLFALIFSALFSIHCGLNVRLLARYLMGGLIPITMITVFKLYYAPPNDIMGSGQSITEKLMDPSRYAFISNFILHELWTHYKMLLLMLVSAMIFNRRYFRSLEFLTALLAFAGYFLVYIITPNDLQWHLSTSCERLFHQFYPALVYTFLLSLAEVTPPARLRALSDRIFKRTGDNIV